jgi:hypothetical protein
MIPLRKDRLSGRQAFLRRRAGVGRAARAPLSVRPDKVLNHTRRGHRGGDLRISASHPWVDRARISQTAETAHHVTDMLVAILGATDATEEALPDRWVA